MKMRTILTVGATFDADGYSDTGELLDALNKAVGNVLAAREARDVTVRVRLRGEGPEPEAAA